jgi:RNase adaptor protein for sRNA GlmZ degradation
MPKIPSEKLRSLASSNKAKDFKRILENDLYPFLDRLPATHQKSLLNILNNVGNKNEAEVLVGYDTRSDSILVDLRALLKSVNSNWKQGWEEQVGLHFWNVLISFTNPSVHTGGDNV